MKFFPGDRVCLITSGKRRGTYGTVMGDWVQSGYVNCYKVRTDTSSKYPYRSQTLCVKGCNLKLEGEEKMGKLSGYKRVAVVEHGTAYSKKDYHFALYDNEINTGDKVIVSGAANGTVLKVKSIIPPEESTVNITAEVICKVNTSAYDQRVEQRKEADRVKTAMDKRKKEVQKMLDDEYYASKDPEYAEMLKRYKELGGE